MTFSNFNPLTGFAGGSLIGAAAAMLLLFNGDIFGCSGIASTTFLSPRQALLDKSQAWKLVFIASFLVTSNLLKSFAEDEILKNDDTYPEISWVGYLIGGFFVGFGTKLGNGCTTGHGICGMARLSKRSLVAVGVFMTMAIGSAVLTSPNVPFAKHTEFLRGSGFGLERIDVLGVVVTALAALLALIVLCRLYILPRCSNEKEECTKRVANDSRVNSAANTEIPTPDLHEDHDKAEQQFEDDRCSNEDADGKQQEQANQEAVAKAKILPSLIAAVLFSAGLAVSQMVLPSKNFGFLDFSRFANGTWDPTLATVMAGGVFVSFIAYQFVSGWSLIRNPKVLECPLASKDAKFNIPTNKNIDLHLIGGAACFGIGWGITGICPGPAVFMAASGVQSIVYIYLPAFFTGSLIAKVIKGQ